MKWRKRGLIYRESGRYDWCKQRTYLPTVDILGDRLRVYFASMDARMVGRVGWVEVEKDNPSKVINVAKKPVLDVGPVGNFDESGVTPSWVGGEGVKMMLYYGWMKTTQAPQILFTGTAHYYPVLDQFVRSSDVPLLDRVPNEPIARSAAMLLKDKGMFKLYYTSAVSGFRVKFNDTISPKYTIRQASSCDGKSFLTRSKLMELRLNNNEFGISRPWVIKDGFRDYKMWYSIRSLDHPYKLGYAESEDGDHWHRKDGEVGITWSESGWDSEMICFPCVVDVEGKRYMFYNGNNHGESGFGYAELEED